MSKRKVRKDFDKSQPITVNVKDCNDYIKEQVHQAFFDVGFTWKTGIQNFMSRGFINSFTNISGLKQGRWEASDTFMWTDYAIGITPKEFFDMVYEPQGHPHAELMMQYAEDAKKYESPWKLWQVRGYKKCPEEWFGVCGHPQWDTDMEYRRKPKTHLVHGVEIPDLRIKPEIGGTYYLANPLSREYFDTEKNYLEFSIETILIERGLVYEHTEEGRQAAILHSKAMLGIADK